MIDYFPKKDSAKKLSSSWENSTRGLTFSYSDIAVLFNTQDYTSSMA